MTDTLIDNLRRQCGGPRDGALLRFSLANALMQQNDLAGAIDEARQALAFDVDYSAAWKLLGKALLASDDKTGAADAWQRGTAAAAKRGDKQAEKEMTVFLRRLDRHQPGS